MIVDIILLIISVILAFVIIGVAVAVCGAVFILSLAYTLSILEKPIDWVIEKIEKKEDDAL